MSRAERQALLEPSNVDLSLSRQCRLLALSRSSVYYRPRAVSTEDLTLMRLIDEQYLKTPFYGSRRMMLHLVRLGHRINRKRVQRLMRTMGLVALYPKPRTSRLQSGHQVYPYRLREVTVCRPNQVGCTDITYVPLAQGFMYLVAIMDWYSRKVLAWRVSNTLDTTFCVAALEEALARHGRPEIFNSDQGSQFTSQVFTGLLAAQGIRISMDGRGCYYDNIFVERLWRTVKYECLYLKTFESGAELRRELRGWFDWYNQDRPHQGLANRTPDEVYSQGRVDLLEVA